MVGFDPQFVWNGIVVGSIIAVSAIGLTLIFGILNFINVAYGEYMAIGAYAAFAFNAQAGHSIYVAALSGLVVAALVGVLADQVVFRPFRNRSPVVLLIVSIGLGFILRNVIRITWGTGVRRYALPIEEAPTVFGIRLFAEQIAIIVIGLVILAGVHLLLQRTDLGIAMRAASNDMDLARLRGVNTQRLVIYVSAVGGAIAGIGGIMLGLDGQLQPTMGFTALIPIFAATILGGIGDPVGAVVGGYTIGILQEVSIVVLPPEYKPAIGLLLLIAGLLAKPEGIFGEATR